MYRELLAKAAPGGDGVFLEQERHMRTISALMMKTVLATSACAQEVPDDLVLDGATLIDGTGGWIDNGRIVIAGDTITCMGEADACEAAPQAEVIDLTGSYITPGLIDGHVHFAQTGWLDGRPDGINAANVYPYEETIAQLRADPGRWHRSYLCTGITGVVDPGGPPWSVTDPHRTDIDRSDRVHVISSGPLISHVDPNAPYITGNLADQPVFLPMDSDEAALESLARVADLGADAVKVWYLNPPADRREELDARLMMVGQAADEVGLELWVHATELRNAKAALRAGADMLVHSVEDQPVDQEFLDLLLANNAVYAPTIRVGRNWRRALSSVVLGEALSVDDPNGCVDEALLDRINHPERMQAAAGSSRDADWVISTMISAGAEEAMMDANLMAVYEVGGRIVVATDAGNPLTVHGPSIYAEMEAMQAAGIPAMDVIAMATSHGARLMGQLDEFGSLAEGKMADLLVLSDDPREDVSAFRSLTHVMRAGDLKTQEELQVRDES